MSRLGEEIDAYRCGNKMYINVKNIPSFKNLIKNAIQQAEELDKTLEKLKQFDLEVEFSFSKPEEESNELVWPIEGEC